jgi:hypothetical protein
MSACYRDARHCQQHGEGVPPLQLRRVMQIQMPKGFPLLSHRSAKAARKRWSMPFVVHAASFGPIIAIQCCCKHVLSWLRENHINLHIFLLRCLC